eukprot:TRINITY_DN4222_c0_g1_i1.p1 TRINITY_DN4222_c0_g1~~TRINITY_DN4222_c0_g1_i1.p1  ORF type:complete len:478 (-),score=110.26 TRINITY_DN4222_c0_g1_i1:22-1455(-)
MARAAGIAYQIFPDRFAKDMSYDHGIADKAWSYQGVPISFADSVYDQRLITERQTCFFGGNLRGVISKLDYLASFGVTIVYLTPIFRAQTTHRYECISYTDLDPILGDENDFGVLIKELTARGMSLYIDLVFNHNSRNSQWHNNQETRRKYYILKHDSEENPEAMTWMNMEGDLPKLDTENEVVVHELLHAVKYWRNKGVGGFRVDAAHLLPHELLRSLRAAASSAPVVVEDWDYAPYYFREPVRADGIANMLVKRQLDEFFIENCSPATLFDRFSTWLDGYPRSCWPFLWNQLENHDTDRFLTRHGGARSAGARAKFFAALAVTFTLPGVPLLYQGEERGNLCDSAHAGECESRMPIDWMTYDRTVLAFVKQLCQLRCNKQLAPVLRDGDWVPVDTHARSRTFVYDRRLGRHVLRVGVNDGYSSYAGSCISLPPHSLCVAEFDAAADAAAMPAGPVHVLLTHYVEEQYPQQTKCCL